VLRNRLTFANVVSLLALFVALGGSSYAAISVSGRNVKNGSLTGKDVRNNSLTGADVNEARLGTVPRATSADSAAKAATADDANALGGVPPSGYVRTPTEPTHLIGTPGNPDFATSYWTNSGQGASAGFFKDQFGIVHLQGDLDPPNFAGTIFTLPPGYRPTHNGATGPVFGVRADSGTGVVAVDYQGRVEALSSYKDNLSLNGITFRAVD
jgi:hypothetical protein